MFTFRRWWLLCGAVLVGVVALNGASNDVADAQATVEAPQPVGDARAQLATKPPVMVVVCVEQSSSRLFQAVANRCDAASQFKLVWPVRGAAPQMCVNTLSREMTLSSSGTCRAENAFLARATAKRPFLGCADKDTGMLRWPRTGVCWWQNTSMVLMAAAETSTTTTSTSTTTTTSSTTTTSTTTTTVPSVVAPVLVSVSASDGVQITVAGMRPDTGVYSLQWVLQGSTFNTYQMARATSPSMSVPAGWFACNRTYTFRVFVMQADWQLADGHQTQNVTPHSTPFDVVMPACTTPTTTPTTTPPGVALTPSFGAPTSTADGFTVQISNYDALFTWAGTATASGVVAISGSGLVTVSGVAARTSSTATITTERSGYSGGSATVTAASQCDPGVVCVVGDTGPGGGIVFYVQASGTFACGATLASTCKYLEVAPNTWSGGSADPTKLWAIVAHQSSDIATIANDSSAYNNALGIGLGYTNSLAIVNQVTGATTGNDTTTAAGAARAYDGGTQSDWYLPTTAELNLLCQWASNVAQSVTTPCTGGTLNTGTGASGGFSSGYYWSSSEVAANNAWVQLFGEGAYQDFNAKKNYPLEVRPVRAFG